MAGSASTTLFAAESVVLDFEPVSDALFETMTKGPAKAPGPGKLLAFGTFNDRRFGIEDFNQITILGPDGEQIPLTVNVHTDSVGRDLGLISSLQFSFTVNEADTAATAKTFTLKWGPDVKAQNVAVDKLVLDPAQRERYRRFQWRAAFTSTSSDTYTAKIDVIAESGAEYYFAWYLLPMTLIFVLLTIRKIHARYSRDSTDS